LKEFGFEKVYHLPGATNPRIFRPIDLTKEERERYNCNISFVGNSIYHALSTFRKYYEWLGDDRAKEVLKKALELQMENHLLDIQDILFEAQNAYGSFLSYPGLEHVDNVRICIEFAAMSLYRKEVVEAVRDLGLRLYGDKGWERLLDGKVKVEGEIDYREEVPLLYNASKINLNITKTQLKTTINQRVFDVGACGGFLLTDYRREIGEFFKPGEEIIYYKDTDGLRELAEYFLHHEDEREEIAKKAMERVLRGHTFKARMERLVEIMVGL
jgi:spore maturation protein CgeB